MIIRSTRVVLPGGVQPASIHVHDGRIARLGPADEGGEAMIDAGNLVISPGVVDAHVHVNEPGRTDWEGFDTATRAAAAGGVTTIVDMPLNSIPATTSAAALAAKRDASRGKCHVDVGFWGGVVPGNASELDALVDAGVRGFKCFLVPSGVDEFPAVGEPELREALPILARRHAPLLVHAEAPGLIAAGGPSCTAYAPYLATRPPRAEVEAIQMVVRLAREYQARVHIVHVACAEAVDVVAGAKDQGVGITAETCPHYLTFAAEEIAAGASEFKCAPPIREARHREALWAGLRRGVLDMVASDHSPAPPAMKYPGDFMRAWGGIASLEVSMSAVWTGLRSRRATGQSGTSESSADPVTIADDRPLLSSLAMWMAAAPALLSGLADRKGRIEVGCDADLVVWDPDAERVVDASTLQQRHKLTPYAGRRLRGLVHATYVRGVCVWDGAGLASPSTGRLL